jgi:hypothetical protein
MRQLPRPKEFLEHRCIAGIWELSIQVITDEVEEGFEVRIAAVFG